MKDYSKPQPWIRIYYPYAGQWYEHGFHVFDWFVVSWGKAVMPFDLPLIMFVKDISIL